MAITEIASSPVIPVISLVVAVISLVVAFVFYRRSRRDKQPCYAIYRQAVIENRKSILPGLSVLYNDEKQQFITVANIAFWNAGNETIRAADIATADPLRITVPDDVRVLSAELRKYSDDANQCGIADPEVTKDGSTDIRITFDFLDKENGMLVQIVHNGEEKTLISVTGKIKGARTLTRRLSGKQLIIVPEKIFSWFFRSPAFEIFGTLSYLLFGMVLTAKSLLVWSTHWYLLLPGLLCLGAAWVLIQILIEKRVPRSLKLSDDE